jgi:hypothetical protein
MTYLYIFLAIVYVLIAYFVSLVIEGSKTYQGKPFERLRCIGLGIIWPITIGLMVVSQVFMGG